MKRVLIFLGILLVNVAAVTIIFLWPKESVFDATKYGVLTENDGLTNSRNLQALVDLVSEKGGTIYIPAGEYLFAANGSQSIGNHCIKMRSNVSIRGDGESTVLMPQGQSDYGLDMFYFNEYLDQGQGIYLENCRFENFVIDAKETSCLNYTSAGKGFMLNLIRNCHWLNVVVKNTDATGFGVDCPINCSIINCSASNCGKAAGEDSPGASGFGIGYGYAPGEKMLIRGCVSVGNKKFGYFFEHQGRFDPNRYDLSNQAEFQADDCYAEGNLYNFGGICAQNVTYRKCDGKDARKESVYFENCRNCYFEN